MSKALPILAMVGAVMALLGALILVQETPAPLLLTLFGLVAAVFLFLRRDQVGLVTGIALVVALIVGTLGALGSITTEGGGVEFGISPAVGQAFLVIAALVPAAALVWARWDAPPSWLAVGGAAALGLAALLALIFAGSLGNQASAAPYLVAVLALAGGLGPGIVALRSD
jgi:hypothetical protein